MTIKFIGACLIVTGCAGFGFLIANALKKECIVLRQLITALEYIISEINYRMTPLPELFRLASSLCTGALCSFFLTAAKELDKHSTINANLCVCAALKKHPDIPKSTIRCLELLGQSIGSFDLTGQTRALEAVKADAERLLKSANQEQIHKQKYYKTLGISAGLALVILFI